MRFPMIPLIVAASVALAGLAAPAAADTTLIFLVTSARSATEK